MLSLALFNGLIITFFYLKVNRKIMERIIIYIDGFNLYFGLKSKGWQRYYWLNLQKLAQNLLTENQQLITTKYFTSRISKPPEKSRRQAT